jgi:hypothetical protein
MASQHFVSMRTLRSLLFLLTMSAAMAARAEEFKLVVPENGVSPDKKLAVAVYNRPDGQESDEGEVSKVFLVKAGSLERLAVLEGVSSDGNINAAVRNVRPAWNPDSKHLIVNSAEGSSSLWWSFFRIVDGKPEPIKLDEGEDHPKGQIVKLLIGHVPTSSIGEWKDVQTLHIEHWSWDASAPEAQAKLKELGISNFNGTLRFVHKLAPDGAWKLAEVLIPSPRKED